MNIFDYVKKYGNLSFEEKEFNEVDNIVFCSLLYLNYSNTGVSKKAITLETAGKQYLKRNFFTDIKRLGIPHKTGYKLLELVITTKRYKDIVIHDYVYKKNNDKQFCAMMFRINNNLEYICYEGTDEWISGWKEDMELSCIFPIPAQVDAINYANKHIKIFGPNIILGGHSKGGNLALIAAMYTKPLKQFRIQKIYNNDGPGLRNKEFESKEYNHIKPKYIHLIPNSSVIGILLRNDITTVIKSKMNNILSHSVHTWVIDDDKFDRSNRTQRSIKIEKNIISWLDNHSDEERHIMFKEIFDALEQADVHKTYEIGKITKLIHIIKNIKNVDRQTKDLLIELIKYYFESFHKEKE